MAVIAWGIIGLLLGLVGGIINRDRGMEKWLTGITVGLAFGLLAGWFGAVMFRVDVDMMFEPVSTACAAGAAAVAVTWWLVVRFVMRHRMVNPGAHRPKPLPHIPNGPM
jgi:hypothetical protein